MLDGLKEAEKLKTVAMLLNLGAIMFHDNVTHTTQSG
jgi:hypothetical protein